MTDSATPAPGPTSPFDAFGVGRLPGSARVELTQRLGGGLADHRGLIDLPALTVLFDDLGGLPFFIAEPGSSIQSRLSMAMMERPALDEELCATAELAMTAGDYGATTVEIRGTGGRLLTVGTARNVRVGRDLVVDGDHVDLPGPVAPAAPLPAALDPVRSGAEIVAAIAAGEAAAGPLAELLGAVPVLGPDGVELHAVAAPWTGNIMGTMHGGVIAAIVALGLSFAAQAVAPAGTGYQLIDYSVGFLRSPQVDGRTVVVRTTAIKVGRRLGVFSAELYDGDVLLAHATADARFDS